MIGPEGVPILSRKRPLSGTSESDKSTPLGINTTLSWVDDKSADVFREFGREDNKRLARQALDSADETLVLEVEATAQPKHANRAVRLRGIGTPVVLSDVQRIIEWPYVNADPDVFQFAHATHRHDGTSLDTTHADFPA